MQEVYSLWLRPTFLKMDSGERVSFKMPGRNSNLTWLLFCYVAQDSKESACNTGDPGSAPGSGRSPKEGNGNTLQYSCLENPMDRGGWRATVHGVAESQTRRKRLSRHASFLPMFVSEYGFFQWWAARPDLVALLASLGEEWFPLCSSIAPYMNLDNNNIYYAIMRIKGVNYEGA